MYVFVRQDLSLQQQLVQAAHAGIQAAASFAFTDPSPNLVAIGVPDKTALAEVALRAESAGIRTTTFFEEDDAMGHTAVATDIVPGDLRPTFKEYRLWRK